MGCISGKEEFNGDNPHTYRVINIDAEGASICTGDMTINRAELTLTCAGRQPMHWPLKGLRRYGCETNLFTFEAGRHCQCPEGVYAFRCRRADQLFLTLQMYIQNPALSLHTVPYRQEDGLAGPARPIGRTAGTAGIESAMATAPRTNATDMMASGLLNGDAASSTTLQTIQRSLLPNVSGGGLPLPASQPDRNMRHSSVGSISGIGGSAYHNNESSLSTPFATAAGNLYQECTTTRRSIGSSSSAGCDTVTAATLPSSPIAALPTTVATTTSPTTMPLSPTPAESNNNVLHKKLSLDIPPAEPAPSPTAECQSPTQNVATEAASMSPGGTEARGPISPSLSYYHNEFPSSANYENTLIGCDYGPDRAYMNVTISEEQKALLLSQQCTSGASSDPNMHSPQPQTPRIPTLQLAPTSSESSPSMQQQHQLQQQQSPPVWPQSYPSPVSPAAFESNRVYQNLDLPMRRPTSAASYTSPVGPSNRKGRLQSPVTPTTTTSSYGTSYAGATPSTPLLTCPAVEHMFSEPSSPSMLYIVLDLDQPSSLANECEPSANELDPIDLEYWRDMQLVPSYYPAPKSKCTGTVPRTPSITAAMSSSATPTTTTTTTVVTNTMMTGLPPESPKNSAMDYAQIDFNKTQALSSTTMDIEEARSRLALHDKQ